MNATLNAPQTYDRRTIALHWVTALLVIGLWALGQTIDLFPKGTARTAARSVHICCGIALALVLAYRIRWRLGGGVTLPSGPAASERLAVWVHRALYLLLLTTVVLGIANSWVRGDSLFGLWRIPEFDPGNRDLRGTVEEAHELAANFLFGLAALHAAAGLVHHLVLKDNVLRRMLPPR